MILDMPLRRPLGEVVLWMSERGHGDKAIWGEVSLVEGGRRTKIQRNKKMSGSDVFMCLF